MRPWLLLLFIYQCLANPSFILTGPRRFQKEGTESLCLNLYNTTKSGNVTFDLQFSETVSRRYEFPLGSDCYTISVPDFVSSYGGRSLKFTAHFGDGSILEGFKMLSFQAKSLVTLIQTDKPLYNPGQLVRLRILSLDHQLMPIEEPISVQIKAPSGGVIQLWNDILMSKGMVQLEQQLVSNPEMGTWKIIVQQGDAVTTKNFLVKELDLQKLHLIPPPRPPKKFRLRLKLAILHPDPWSFKQGIPVVGEVQVTANSDISLAKRTVRLCLSGVCTNSTADKVCSDFTTDEAGKIPYSFVPAADCYMYSFSAEMHSPAYAKSDETLFQVYSSSGNGIYLGEVNTDVECGGVLKLPLIFTGSKGDELSVRIQVVSRGDVVFSKHDVVSYDTAERENHKLVNNLLKKQQSLDSVKKTLSRLRVHTISYKMTGKESPTFKVIIFAVRKEGEILATWKKIDVKSCFPNIVQMKWSSKRSKPGGKVNLSVSGYQGSYCGTSVVDKSALLLQPDIEHNENSILSGLEKFDIKDSDGSRETTEDRQYCTRKLSEEERELHGARDPLRYFKSYYREQIFAFDRAGLFVMSNLPVETRPCEEKLDSSGKSTLWLSANPGPIDSLDVRPLHEKEVRPWQPMIRGFFPETWLWDGFFLNDEGKYEQAAEAPNSTATWVGRALCISTVAGFGISSGAELEVTQLLSVEFNLPYSVKRGEVLTLKVSAFNYADRPLPIGVRIPANSEYEIVSRNLGPSKCVQSQHEVVHTFEIKLSTVGNINISVEAFIDELDSKCGPKITTSAKETVVKSLLVLPGGLPVEKTFADLLFLKESEEDKVTLWNLTVPENTVEGSVRAWITVDGDLMGPTITGLGSLVDKPVECGVKNMFMFTPIVYVLQYLETIKKCDPTISKKAIRQLETGYVIEQKFRHSDGSYSAFGDKDPSGSMWLTAFAVRSFAAASKFIRINEEDLERSLNWILTKQMDNGCFPSVGRDFSFNMEGESKATQVGITAIVVASLAEAKISGSEKAIQNALMCLKAETSQNDYILSLTAYALARAGDNESAATLIATLLERAKKGNSLLWWEQDNEGLAVEMTAYNLMTLTLLGGQAGDKTYMAHALSAVRWISQHRNGHAGFYSKLDPVVAVQAMALYASSVPQTELEVLVSLDATNFEDIFMVTEDIKLVQMQLNLPVLPTALKIETVGQGCVVVQAQLRYNLPVKKQMESFDINASLSSELEITGCVKYLEDGTSNMAVVDIELLSGHTPNKDSIHKLKENKGIKRVDVKEGHVFLYYDKFDSNKRCFSLHLDEEFKVADLKPASLVVYDYYTTHRRGTFDILPPTKSSS